MMMNFPLKPGQSGNREKDDLAKVFHTFVWVEILAVTFLMAALAVLYGSHVLIWVSIYLSLIVVSLVGLWLNRHGNTRRAVIGLLAGYWLVTTIFPIFNNAILPPNSNRYVLIVVAAGLLLGTRAGFFAALGCSLTEAAIVMMIKLGFLTVAGTQLQGVGLLVHVVILLLAALLPALATRSVRNALASAKEELNEHRRSEAANMENEARYLALVDNSPDAIMIHSEGNFVHLNHVSLQLLRASPDQLLGKSIMQIVHPEYRDLVANVLEQMRTTRTSSQIREGKLVRLDGTIADVETASMPVRFKGQPAIQTIVRDVTDYKAMQEQVRIQIAALNSAANGIVITDREGVIVWANASFERLTGYTPEEAVGKKPGELVKSGKQKPSFYKDMWDTIVSGKVWHGELVNRRKDNSLYTEFMTITPVLDQRGEISHFVAVKQDVTSQKLLEEQLLQAQKLQGIGQLAGGVAHDYNNILNVVVGYSELLRRKLSEGDPARQSLDAIVNAARRGADLTRQLLAFARREILTPKVININSAIESIRNMLHRIIGENIRLAFVPARELGNVRIDPTQFDQILVNLASNARDAIEDIGTITIKTEKITFDWDHPPDMTELALGEYVRITLEDSGCGMDNETMNHLFEPFFTTKPKGHGTGLGLSTVYGIVKQNQGAIDVDSKPGGGTRFTIYLPRFEGATSEPELEIPEDSDGGTETILVVEDQADLLNLAKTSLEELGYNVMTSLDPADAELLSEAYAGEIHLLLTDIIMPKMGGIELSRKLTGHRPLMKTLYMSGYSPEAIPRQFGSESGLELIEKPFRLRELATKVRQVLGS